MKSQKMIWGLDPGNLICGVCCLVDGRIHSVFSTKSVTVFREILERSAGYLVEIAIEDIFPYQGRLSPQIIDTCKVIGELTYRFNTADWVEKVHLVPRNRVKNWIFDRFPRICLPRINQKMITIDRRRVQKGFRGLTRLDGTMRLPSFHYVDDRIVVAAMKNLYRIREPKPGKRNKLGINGSDHAWQALATASCFIHMNPEVLKSSI